MARRHVAFVLDTTVDGGAERYVLSLAERLAADAARPAPAMSGLSWVPAVVATDGLPADLKAAFVAAGVPVRTVRAVRCKADVAGLLGLRRAILAAAPDVVHVNLAIPTNNRHAVAAALATGAPTLVTLHLPGDVAAGAQHRLLRALFGSLQAAVAVSREAVTELVEVLRMRPMRVHHIVNGVADPGACPPPERPAGAPVVVGCLGRLTAQKGYDVLIDAAARLQDHGVPVVVRVAGDGPDGDALAEQAVAAGVALELLGHIDDVPGFLCGLDVYCLPSRHEGLPLALLAALLAGLPCVVTDVGDVAEAVGGTAVVVPPEDPEALAGALVRLATSPARRRSLGARARQRALGRFGIDRLVTDTVAVYERAWRNR